MDKQELRQDPIREKILSSLSYVENNKSVLSLIIGAFILVIVASGYYSSTTKALNSETSIKFGKAINSSIDGNEPDASVFSDIISSGSRSGAANSLIYMIDYNLKQGNDFAVDSLLALDITVEDKYLQSKLLSLKGDRAFDRMEYDGALGYYQDAKKLDVSMENSLNLKQISVHIEMGNKDEAMGMLNKMLEDEALPFDVKSSCNSYLSMLENKS